MEIDRVLFQSQRIQPSFWLLVNKFNSRPSLKTAKKLESRLGEKTRLAIEGLGH